MRRLLYIVAILLLVIVWSMTILFVLDNRVWKHSRFMTNFKRGHQAYTIRVTNEDVNSTPKFDFLSPNITQIVIIFPFRNRSTHYTKMMERLWDIKKKHWNITVYVIHQDDDNFFKRAWLINVGLELVAKRFADDTCVVTHDVDMLPSPQIDYTWCDVPTQICSELSCFNHKIPYNTYAGGTIQATLKHWKQINGMTNRARGWGGEDDDLYYRLKANNYIPIRRPKYGHGKCTCLNDANHTKRIKSDEYESIVRQIDRLSKGSDEWKTDGLNSLNFRKTSQYIDKWGSNWFGVSSMPKAYRAYNSNIVVTRSDRIMQVGYDASPIILEQYGLVLFTIPKSACTVIKQLARRIAGKKDWDVGGEKIPHNPAFNGLTYLSSLNIEKATTIMTSPNWTRAVFVRDPYVRILSAYLDKAVKRNYVKQVCGTQPHSFAHFLELTTKCKDPHWQSQRSFIDKKWWPFINFIGHIETAANDTERLLRGMGLWERYGKYGWGPKNESIFERNQLKSRATGSDDKLGHYYTRQEYDKVSRLYRDDMEFCSQRYNTYLAQDNIPQQVRMWSDYRLGDILRYWWASFRDWNTSEPFPCRGDKTICHAFVCTKWPQSIGCRFLQSASLRITNETFCDNIQYMDRTQRDVIFFKLATDILQNIDGNAPLQNSVVVHVRLSDALTRDDCWLSPPCTYAGRLYAYPLTWYDKVVQDIHETFGKGTIPNIEIIGYQHHIPTAQNTRRSENYRAKIVQYFRGHGFPVTVHPQDLPDNDFLYMTRAKYFVPGGGGFSRMVAYFIERHGGKIFRLEDLNTTLSRVSPPL